MDVFSIEISFDGAC